jgi:pantoate kinase
MFAPADEGSYGVSFTTEDGVLADASPAEGASTDEPARPGNGEATVTLDGERTTFEPVELACRSLGVDARVDLTADVPVGCGFGASGAATLATALAADAEWNLGYDREELVEVAARAEIEAGTGLGDVYVQDRGGLVWDVGEGREHRARTDPIEYASFGVIRTEDVLGDEDALDRVASAADGTFPRFDPDASVAELFEVSWEFAETTGLVTDQVREAVERVRTAGGSATMAMVGETVVAAGADGALDERTRLSPEAARILAD